MRDYKLRRLPSVLIMIVMGATLARLLIVSVVVGNPAIAVDGLVMAVLGLPLAWLASIEEANLWREAGIWISVLAYAGTMVGGHGHDQRPMSAGPLPPRATAPLGGV